MRVAGLALAVFGIATFASAHVTVAPRESKPGATENYRVRVPTEGKVATVSVDLEIPAGVMVTNVSAPAGGQYELKREGDRIVGITWKIKIDPGDMSELPFTAKNPGDGASISWKAHQHFADGTTADWSGPAGDRHPASITKLTPASGPK